MLGISHYLVQAWHIMPISPNVLFYDHLNHFSCLTRRELVNVSAFAPRWLNWISSEDTVHGGMGSKRRRLLLQKKHRLSLLAWSCRMQETVRIESYPNTCNFNSEV